VPDEQQRAAEGLKYTALSSDPDESHALAFTLLGDAKRVLEIGAATGYISEALIRRGIDVVPVEIDADAAAVARARGIDIRVGAVDAVVRSGESFDCVLLLDVIEHVPDAGALLRACLRHLSPGGRVVMSVPNIAHWRIRKSLLAGRFDYTPTGLLDETHVHFYTVRSLTRLLASNGLSVVERKYSLGLYEYGKTRTREWEWQRRKLLRLGVRRWPGLFAQQFVWRAVRTDDLMSGTDRESVR
jgi:2-polyprenyl-3-methyl-5-hydroxy-6-metoxy-1,4-benzoquinol methylase